MQIHPCTKAWTTSQPSSQNPLRGGVLYLDDPSSPPSKDPPPPSPIFIERHNGRGGVNLGCCDSRQQSLGKRIKVVKRV